jgi:hypothetical protein
MIPFRKLLVCSVRIFALEEDKRAGQKIPKKTTRSPGLRERPQPKEKELRCLQILTV